MFHPNGQSVFGQKRNQLMEFNLKGEVLSEQQLPTWTFGGWKSWTQSKYLTMGTWSTNRGKEEVVLYDFEKKSFSQIHVGEASIYECVVLDGLKKTFSATQGPAVPVRGF